MDEKLFSKNFILLITGQAISMFGTTILKFAISLYILDLTGSAVIFGMIMGISTISTVLFSPFGGIVADRLNRRNLMVILDFSYGVVAVGLAILLSVDHSVEILGLVLMLLSVVSSLEAPVVQSCIPLIHSKEKLVKANSVVNQVIMLVNLIAPVLAGLQYSYISIKNIVLLSSLCFFSAAVIETFIRIPYQKSESSGRIFQMVSKDFHDSYLFVAKEQPIILKTLMIIASLNLFISSMLIVGIPYIIRIILMLSSEMNGIAEGVMAGAGLLGGLTAGLISSKLKVSKLYTVFIALGVFLLPLAVSFLVGLSSMSIYAVLLVCCVLIQIAASIISIFSLSAIQERTPPNMLGRVMAYVITITTCAQPFGQALYGFMFDVVKSNIFWLIFVTAGIVILIGIIVKPIYRSLDR